MTDQDSNVHLDVFHYPEVKQGSPDALTQRLAANIRYRYGNDIPEPAEYEILITASPTLELLEASPRLRAVIIPYAGASTNTVELLRRYPHLTLHNAPYNYIATAETALALMLASVKFLAQGDRALRRHDWTLRYSDRPQLLLHRRTALILGYGRIGRHMAPVCKALGMEVLGVRRSLRPEDGVDPFAEVHSNERLHDLLPRADILLITLPDTPETRGLIGAPELELLPEGSVLVNVGRATVVDEEALYTALKSGRLAAAGLDVWYRYPRTEAERTATAPSRFPFHELDRVILSPHRAGWLGQVDDTRMVYLAEMLNRVAESKSVPNQVDLERGY